MDVVEIPLGNSGLVAVIDAEDFEAERKISLASGEYWIGRICELKWKLSRKRHTNYAISTTIELRLHRAVLNAEPGRLVDHIDHNGLNNRRSNLRFAGFQGNSANRLKQLGLCVSRFKGVGRVNSNGKWTAQIRVNGKKRHLGCFTREEDAAKTYDTMAQLFFGKFAETNF